jgi:DNA-binding protein HU-beta
MNKSNLARAILLKTREDEDKEEDEDGTGSTGPKLASVKRFLNAFIETVSEELKNKGKVTLVGFGTFAVAHRKEKTGVNPKTGDKIAIKAKDVPVFKAGKGLKEMVK